MALKNELKVLTTTAQTLVSYEHQALRIINIVFYNPTASATSFDLTLTDKTGTKITLRKGKSLGASTEDVINYMIVLEKGDKLEAVASAANNINVLVNYEPYNGSPGL